MLHERQVDSKQRTARFVRWQDDGWFLSRSRFIDGQGTYAWLPPPPRAHLVRTNLECAGRAQRRRRFGFDIQARLNSKAIQSGVALRLPRTPKASGFGTGGTVAMRPSVSSCHFRAGATPVNLR